MFRWGRSSREKLAELKQQAEEVLRSKRYTKALSLAAQALKEAPDDPDFLRIRADALLGEPHSREVAAEASAIYSYLTQRNPTDPTIWVRLVLALLKENRLAEALAASEQAVISCPNVAGL